MVNQLVTDLFHSLDAVSKTKAEVTYGKYYSWSVETCDAVYQAFNLSVAPKTVVATGTITVAANRSRTKWLVHSKGQVIGSFGFREDAESFAVLKRKEFVNGC